MKRCEAAGGHSVFDDNGVNMTQQGSKCAANQPICCRSSSNDTDVYNTDYKDDH